MADEQIWQGKWTWIEGPPRAIPMNEHELVYFRRTFHVKSPKAKLVMRVSADSRYRLYINGESVGVGPCKGDGKTHYYETYDVSQQLRTGKNVIALKVLHYAASGTATSPDSIWRSNQGAFILDGVVTDESGEVSTVIETIHSDERWRARKDESVRYVPESWMSSIWLGGVERADGRQALHGWNRVDYNDEDWGYAVPFLEPASPYGVLTPWQLTERTIPFLHETPRSFTRIMRRGENQGVTAQQEQSFYTLPCDSEQAKLELPPNTKHMVELDAGLLTTGYVQVEVTGGAGSVIRLQPSECYEQPGGVPGRRNKGIRDDCSNGQVLLGDSDIYTISGHTPLEGDDREIYEPFWWRTFRFLRVEIEVGDAPLRLHSLHYRETGYPLEVKSSFRSSDESFGPLWDISINTLKRCMHETYEDCPFYEQLQYTMDTRLQILFTYYISGDDRLARKAIHDYHSSLLPNGMLQSRYPAYGAQVIPGFALYWIYMVYDHYQYFADEALVRRYRPTADAVLDYFDRKLTPEGLVGKLENTYWSFVDWTKEWNPNHGVPPAGSAGPLTVYSLMYAVALQNAAVLNQRTGRADVAREYRERAANVLDAVRRNCWSLNRKMFRDGPQVEQYSQQVQIWSILSGAVTGDEAVRLMEATLTDPSLSQASYAMSFFTFRALSQLGLYEKAFALWDTWRDMAALNLTTWVEDPVGQRSDCHAWGAVPLYEFPAEILGVKAGAPGFELITVEPKIGHMTFAEGTVVTPKGDVCVSWRAENGRFQIAVQGPEGVPLQLRLPGPGGRDVPFINASNVHWEGSLHSAEANRV